MSDAAFWWPELAGTCSGAAKTLIRETIIPADGMKFICADYNAIEARVTSWVAGEMDAIETFRAYDAKTGPDIYCKQASGLFNRIITKDNENERQIGKVCVLALGYQGGIGSFISMAKNYGVSLDMIAEVIISTPDELELATNNAKNYIKQNPLAKITMEQAIAVDVVKQRWRKVNPSTVKFWKEIEKAAHDSWAFGSWDPATLNGGKFYHGIKFSSLNRDKKERQFLYLHLPSGRKLAYYAPKIQEMTTPWGEQKTVLTSLTWDSQKNTMRRRAMYGGLLTENIVQALSRDIMVRGMWNCYSEGHQICLHTHDEVMVEVDPLVPVKDIESLLVKPISWAKDLPLAAAGWEGYRYRK